ncbi:filament integrity protein FraC [Pantanalinema sp. GBBB05]|uniref:filament integrity protein FraC n=1 Tax=Pantanalinema sp. GBBB05 TaxID=2604139 RepID=UPI001DA9AA12|nr:filament integrity protein fraC [Pantanalinema sp. GBBB05]
MIDSILPLRAIVFQMLFLLVTIALEGLVFFKNLNLDYKTSMRYAAVLNLFSTFLGWVIFFEINLFLPEDIQRQFISYIFFDRFFPNPWFAAVTPIIVITSLAIFIGTFLLELNGLELLEYLLDKSKNPPAPTEHIARFQGRRDQIIRFQANTKAYTVLVANAASFSAILLLLIIRWIEQNQRVSG